MGQERAAHIAVYRARPRDCEHIADFLSRVLPAGRTITDEDVLGHLGGTGLLVAECDGEPVGLLGWRIEDLVARITDFLIVRPKQQAAIARALLGTMERTARDLECEAAILLMPHTTAPQVALFMAAFGYERREVAGLPRPWREAAAEAPSGADGTVLLKQLRQERVLRPI